jgi:hypothetical protein
MTSLTLDSSVLSRLNNLDGLTEFRDESGRVLGYFHPLMAARGASASHRSPFTDEELRERQRQRSGKPLSDVLASLPA